MNELKEAQKLLTEVYPAEYGDSILFGNGLHHTTMITYGNSNIFKPVFSITIHNHDLMKLYDYAKRMNNGEEVFEWFEGNIVNIDGGSLQNFIVDLFYALTEIIDNKVAYVADIETIAPGTI